MWGNGLQNPDKFVEKVGEQVANLTQRNVKIVSFAHSGARLKYCDSAAEVPMKPSDNGVPPGDLNSELPSTRQQAEIAAYLPNLHYDKSEIVLLDGCINEVSATDISLPFPLSLATPDDIQLRSFRYCAQPMRDTLSDVQSEFPRATIILLNYYRIVSSKSTVDHVQAAATEQNAAQVNTYQEEETAQEVETARKKQEEIHDKENERLLSTEINVEKKLHLASTPTDKAQAEITIRKWDQNSAAFLAATEACFKWAVAGASGVNVPPLDTSPTSKHICPPVTLPPAQVATTPRRVYIATVPDNPDYSYGAPQKHIWSAPIQFLFWTIHADNLYSERSRLCRTHYRDDLKGRLGCKVNPTAHPNVVGAEVYQDSIVSVLKIAWDNSATPAR